MASTRELRVRIRSIRNLAQVTKALETVSASRVRKAIQADLATRPYSEKAWKLLLHLARQPGSASLHPLLKERPDPKQVLVLLVSSDRGLAGAYPMNVLRAALQLADRFTCPVRFVAIGRKGHEQLLRRNRQVSAEFSGLASPPDYLSVAPIGRLVVEDFEDGLVDRVYICFTEYVNMIQQRPQVRQLLPLDVKYVAEHQPGLAQATHRSQAVFNYEPDQDLILGQIVPRFITVQIYQAVLSATASEHAARMIAMKNATDAAHELIDSLRVEYNELRQTVITNEMLDIAGGANALAQSGRRE